MDGTRINPLEGKRYEIKYALNPGQVPEFERWLLGAPFTRRSFPARRVNSVYFDTSVLSAADDNLRGIADRKKYRVRWYGDKMASDAPLTLEVKIKSGRLGSKATTRLDANLGSLLQMGARDIEAKFHADPAVRDLIPREAALQPVLYVGYNRQYFEGAHGIRITIDQQLVFADIIRDRHFMDHGDAAYAKAIVEFKFAPHIKDDAAEMMQNLPLYPVRSSKYITGLSLFGHAVYI